MDKKAVVHIHILNHYAIHLKLIVLYANYISKTQKSHFENLQHMIVFFVMKKLDNFVIQSCPTLCDPMDYSMPGLPVHHQLPEFTQTHVH